VKCLEYDLHVTGEEIEEVLEEWGFDCFWLKFCLKENKYIIIFQKI
jgi:hypothetical protein